MIATATMLLGGCGIARTQNADAFDLAAGLAADEPKAVMVGREALAAGGTAADAAAAMALAMSATLPARVGLGGGGACVVHDPARKTVRTLDFLPRAQPGGQAAVPGMLRGLYALQSAHGRLRWAQVVAPAEGLARQNRTVSRAAALDFGDFEQALAADPEARRVFVAPLGHAPDEGEPLAQPDLAAVLGQVRQSGVGPFYAGASAARLAEAAGLPVDAVRGYQPAWRGTKDARRGYDTLHFADLPEGQPALAAWEAATSGGGDRARAVLGALGGAPGGAPSAAIPTASLVAFDPDGMSVACAFSMGGPFGTGRMVPGTGVFLARPTGAAGIGGPLVVANRNTEKGTYLAAGSLGLEEEGPAAAQAALVAASLAALDRGAAARDAVAAGRVVPAPGGGVLVEQNAPAALAGGLGGGLGQPARAVPVIGRANLVLCKVRDDGARKCEAQTDPRGFGLALTGG